MREAMARQQWQRAAHLGHHWRQSGGRDWQVTVNLAISLCHTKHGTEQDLMLLAGELWTESDHNESAKLGLSELLIKMARYEDCIALLDQIKLENPSPRQDWRFTRLKADALAKIGDFAGATALLETQSPESRGWRWHMARAGVASQRSEWQIAEQHYRFILKLQPDYAMAHHNLGLTLLSQQQWQEGWQEYEWRRSNPRSNANGIPKPIPSLDTLHNRRVVVVGEQGIGDQIMMMRFLPELSDHCRSLVVKVEARLIELFRRALPPEIQIQDKKNDRTEPNTTDDVLIGSGSLPLLCGGATATDPTATAPIQLKPNPNLVHRWSEQLKDLAKGKRILGLGWLGGTSNEQQRERGLNPENIQSLVADQQDYWIDLQHLHPRWQHLRSSHGSLCQQLIDNPGRDLDLTLALMASLHGIVTTRQTVAHLAGGLGLQGAVLVPTRQEWRYSQSDGPWAWYPSLQCHNQQDREDWTQTIQRVLR